jgi:hypothetical protein
MLGREVIIRLAIASLAIATVAIRKGLTRLSVFRKWTVDAISILMLVSYVE